MFKGEKIWVFWVGLIMSAVAFFSLFQILWSLWVNSDFWSDYWKAMVPQIVGFTVFILIGLFMMKSGVKKKDQPKPAERAPTYGVENT